MTRLSSMCACVALLLTAGCGEQPPAAPAAPPAEPPRPVTPESTPEEREPEPGLHFERPSAEAGYDSSPLVAAVMEHDSPIRRCFENLAVHDNVRPGRVLVTFTVEIDGSIVRARALQGGTYGDCVAEEVERIRLETGPDEPVVVLYPMFFVEALPPEGG